MGQGMTRSGYFIFTGRGEIFDTLYGDGKIRKYFFKKCTLENNEIVYKDPDQYQMYVPVDNEKFNFQKGKIYELTEVSHAAGKENISGTKNLSHFIYPIEYSYEEFKHIWEKNMKKKKNTCPALLKHVQELDKQDREEINKRFGRK